MSSSPGLRRTFRSPDLWVGLILGTILGRTVDLISDDWWIYLLVAGAVLFPSVIVKDQLTARVYRKRDAILAANSDMRNRQVWWVRISWSILDFIIGVLVLAPSGIFLLWFGSYLNIR